MEIQQAIFVGLEEGVAGGDLQRIYQAVRELPWTLAPLHGI